MSQHSITWVALLFTSSERTYISICIGKEPPLKIIKKRKQKTQLPGTRLANSTTL